MKFKKTAAIFLLNVSLLFWGGCSSPLIYNSVWQNTPVTIDGKAKEWKIPLDYYDDKTKLNFSVSNDRSNIYFCIRATEDDMQKGIIHTGLQIWIDTTGGKTKRVGIQFPVIQKTEMSSGSSSPHRHQQEEQLDETSMVNNLKRQYSGINKEIKLTGFSNAVSGLTEVPNIYGINVCLNWDTNNIMIYEVCIPFSTFYKAALTSSDTNKVLGISIIVPITPKNENSGDGHEDYGGGNMGGGMPGGEMADMHRGGRHGGGGSSSEPVMRTAYIKFRLATKPI